MSWDSEWDIFNMCKPRGSFKSWFAAKEETTGGLCKAGSPSWRAVKLSWHFLSSASTFLFGHFCHIWTEKPVEILTGRRCRWFGKQCDINIKKRWQDAWAAKAEFTDDVNTCCGGFSLFSNSNISFTPSYEADVFASLSLSSKSLLELWHVCVYLFFSDTIKSLKVNNCWLPAFKGR